jgi:hypothetical protein
MVIVDEDVCETLYVKLPTIGKHKESSDKIYGNLKPVTINNPSHVDVIVYTHEGESIEGEEEYCIRAGECVSFTGVCDTWYTC